MDKIAKVFAVLAATLALPASASAHPMTCEGPGAAHLPQPLDANMRGWGYTCTTMAHSFVRYRLRVPAGTYVKDHPRVRHCGPYGTYLTRMVEMRYHTYWGSRDVPIYKYYPVMVMCLHE
jgi:hypothetical protein